MVDKQKFQAIASKLDSYDPYNKPSICPNCRARLMNYTGGGSYTCPSCKHVEYDDWGKVREYLYKHKNATAQEIEKALGIPRIEVKQMLRDAKIEIIAKEGALDSFIRCERCGKAIQSGTLCSTCGSTSPAVTDSKLSQDLQMKKTGSQLVFNPNLTRDEGRMRFNPRKH